MKKLFVILFVILFPFSSYGKSIVDKGLVCLTLDENFPTIPLLGFWFGKYNVVSLFEPKNESWFDDVKGKYKVNDFSISIFIEEPNLHMGRFTINRNNGELTHKKYVFYCDKPYSLKEEVRKSLKTKHYLIVKMRINEKKEKQKQYEDKLNKRKF